MMSMIRRFMSKELQGKCCLSGSVRVVKTENDVSVTIKKDPIIDLENIEMAVLRACQLKFPSWTKDKKLYRDAVKGVTKNPLEEKTKFLKKSTT